MLKEEPCKGNRLYLDTLMKLTDPREVSTTMSCFTTYLLRYYTHHSIAFIIATSKASYVFIEDGEGAGNPLNPGALLLMPQLRWMCMPKRHRQSSEEVPILAAVRWHCHARMAIPLKSSRMCSMRVQGEPRWATTWCLDIKGKLGR